MEEAREYAICQLDPQGRIQSWNPGAERLFGRRAEEVLGRAFSVFHPQDEVRAGKLGRDLALARAQGSAHDEAWLVRKDGGRFMASVVLTATRDADGVPTGFMGVVHDLTERLDVEARLLAQARDLESQVAARTSEVQESEARIQSFIRHAPAAIAVKGLDGRLLMVNRKAEALIGMCQAATPDGCGGKIFPPELAARAREQDEEVLTRRKLIQAEESVQPSGRVRAGLPHPEVPPRGYPRPVLGAGRRRHEHHGAQAGRTGPSPAPEAGCHRPSGRGDRPRFQQPAGGHGGQCGTGPAGTGTA